MSCTRGLRLLSDPDPPRQVPDVESVYLRSHSCHVALMWVVPSPEAKGEGEGGQGKGRDEEDDASTFALGHFNLSNTRTVLDTLEQVIYLHIRIRLSSTFTPHLHFESLASIFLHIRISPYHPRSLHTFTPSR